MQKKPRLILSLFALILIILALGYSALWYVQANEAKKQIIHAIERVNNGKNIISYESIQTLGFPTHVTVRIHKPKFDVPVHEIARPFGESMPPAPDGTDQAELRKALLELPEWHEQMALDGYVDIKVSALSHAYTIAATGNYNIVSNIADETKNYSYVVEAGKRGCTLRFKPEHAGLKLWSWDYLQGNPETFLTSLESLKCEIPVQHVAMSDGTALLDSAASSIAFENHAERGINTYKLLLDFPEYTGTAALDDLLKYYYHAIYPNKLMPAKYEVSANGKQQLRVKASASLNRTAPQSAPVSFKLEEFNFASDLGATNSTAEVNFTPEGKGGKASWDFHLSTSANEQAYQKYMNDAVDVAHDIYDRSIAAGNTVPFTRDAFAAQFQSIVPRVHELGSIIFNFAGNGDINEQQQVHFNIENFELSSSPYGISGTATGEMASPVMPIPQGEFNLLCRNCMPLVDDATAWFARLIPLFSAAPQEARFQDVHMTEAVVAGIKDFLLTLAPESVDDFRYMIVMDGKNEPTVNGKPLTEVLTLYQEKIGALLPVEGKDIVVSPAAGEQPIGTPSPADAPATEPKAAEPVVMSPSEQATEDVTPEPAKEATSTPVKAAEPAKSAPAAAVKKSSKPKPAPAKKPEATLPPPSTVDSILPGSSAIQ